MAEKKRYLVYQAQSGDPDGPHRAEAGEDSLLLVHPNGKVALTPLGGLAVKLTNGTGDATVKGQMVSLSTGADDTFVAQSGEFDSVGAVFEADVAVGAEAWVVIAGIAEVLLEDDGGNAVHGDWLGAADTDGVCYPGSNPTGIGDLLVGTHFKEIGHCLQSGTQGTLVRAILHFN